MKLKIGNVEISVPDTIFGAGILLTIAGAIFFGLLLIIGIVLIGIGIILELDDRDLLWLKR